MKFRIWTILWVFALFASAMATLGGIGILPALTVLGLWTLILKQTRSKLIEWLTALGIIGALLALVLPFISSARQAASRFECTNNMKVLALALHDYHGVHGNFPPAYLEGPDGTPWHSWRVAILPFLKQKQLYDLYDFDEPWNGPNNRELWSKMPDVFRCPVTSEACSHGFVDCSDCSSNYFAVVGPDAAWIDNQGAKLANFKGGTASTIMLVEATRSDSCWMEPRDLSKETVLSGTAQGVKVGHLTLQRNFFTIVMQRMGCNAAFVDGHVNYVHGEIDRTVLAWMLSRNDGGILVNETTAPNADDGPWISEVDPKNWTV